MSRVSAGGGPVGGQREGKRDTQSEIVCTRVRSSSLVAVTKWNSDEFVYSRDETTCPNVDEVAFGAELFNHGFRAIPSLNVCLLGDEAQSLLAAARPA